jgi:hypothetical protein
MLDLVSVGKLNRLQFSLLSDEGRFYRIESSSNLTRWTPATNFLRDVIGSQPNPTSIVFASNNLMALFLPAMGPALFVRALRYSPANEVCNVNLKQLRFAKQMWAIEKKRALTDTPMDADLVPYLGANFRLNSVRCPSAGVYQLRNIGVLPLCTIPGHTLEEPE